MAQHIVEYIYQLTDKMSGSITKIAGSAVMKLSQKVAFQSLRGA
jgi:hypothetical protein